MSLNIIIPVAGRGLRFSEFGFQTPKILLPVDTTGKTVLQCVVDSLDPPSGAKYVFILKKDLEYRCEPVLRKYVHKSVVKLIKDTNGPASTTMKGMVSVARHSPILVCESTKIISDWSARSFLDKCGDTDCAILVKKSDSHIAPALCGIYYFKNKQIFAEAYEALSSREFGGEFSLPLLCDAMVDIGKDVSCVALEDHQSIHDIETPANYLNFINNVTHFGPERTFGVVCNTDNLNVRVCGSGTVRIDAPSLCVMLQGSLYIRDMNYRSGDICIVERSFFLDKDSKAVIVSHNVFETIPAYKRSNLRFFRKGWIVGNFTPSFVKTNNFEVGILHRPADKNNPFHIHDTTVDYNYIISGSLKLSGIEFKRGDSYVLRKGHPSVAEVIEDCSLVCVKIPSNLQG